MKKIMTPKNHVAMDESMIEFIFSEEGREDIVSQQSFCKERISYGNMAGFDVQQCLFTQCQLWHADVRATSFVDCAFIACDFSNSDFSKTVFHRCEFKDCKLMGADFSRSYLRNVLFENCLASDSNWNQSDQALVNYTSCRMENASIGESKWNVGLDGCDVTHAYLLGTSLSGIDFSSCEIGGFVVDMNQLKGCMVSAMQAADLIQLLGVVVKD